MRKAVLLVQDDPLSLNILTRRLTREGYTVSTASNGAEALQALKNDPPDLVVSEWTLADMNGRDLCRQFKDVDRSIYFVLLTAHDSEEELVETLEAGADEYLLKPLNVQELLARMNAGMRIAALQRDLQGANKQLTEAMSRIDKEMRVIAAIQLQLLPQALPEIPGLSLHAFYRPSTECGGDYYDIFPLPGGLLGLVMADVSGHGAPAMVAMSMTRQLTHEHIQEYETPDAFLSYMNMALDSSLPTDQYVTMFYAIFDPATGILRYSSAGQPAPMRRRAEVDDVEPLPNCEGFPLKLVKDLATYESFQMTLAPGDSLLMYTDGVNEMMNSEMKLFGTDRLRDSFLAYCRKGGGPFEDTLVRELDEFATGTPQQDDITILGLRLIP